MKAIINYILISVAVVAIPQWTQAAAGGNKFPLDSVHIDHNDKASLQRGVRTFVNYCMGCHSASYHRYSRLAADLGLPEDLVKTKLIFTTDEQGEPTKIGAPMENSMGSDYAKAAFGTVPPDLALVSRSRGSDWLYTFLRTFYLQPERSGVAVNNLVFPDVGMPHVLWELQGWQEAIFEEQVDEYDNAIQRYVGRKQITQGKLTPEEYDTLIRDLVNFLDYLGDPVKLERYRIGVWVLLFVGIFWGLALLLKREYWKDIH